MENVEIWKDVLGYEGLYQVSNLGNVKILSVKKLNGRYYSLCKEKILKPSLNGVGYYQVRLQKNKESKTISIHKLVAINFLNHVPCGYKLVVNHINFDRTDNRVENLEIVTSRENCNRKHLKSTSKYTGVHWYKQTNKWRSKIVVGTKHIHLGFFKNEIDAHNAYQKALCALQLDYKSTT